MAERRAYLTSLYTGLATATAGCGFTLGNEPAMSEASPAAMPDSTQEGTEYQFTENEEMEVERGFPAGGQSKTVVPTNVLRKHEKSITLPQPGDQRAGVFTVLMTPKVEVLGETFNPIEDISAKDIAKMVRDRYSGFDGLEHVGQSEVGTNGNTTLQVNFATSASLAGSPVDINSTAARRPASVATSSSPSAATPRAKKMRRNRTLSS